MCSYISDFFLCDFSSHAQWMNIPRPKQYISQQHIWASETKLVENWKRNTFWLFSHYGVSYNLPLSSHPPSLALRTVSRQRCAGGMWDKRPYAWKIPGRVGMWSRARFVPGWPPRYALSIPPGLISRAGCKFHPELKRSGSGQITWFFL